MLLYEYKWAKREWFMKELLLKKDAIYNFNVVEEASQNKHFHKDIELIYIMEGSLKLEIENELFSLNRDDIVVINSNKKHSFKSNKKSIIVHFHFSYEYLSSFLNKNFILFWCNSTVKNELRYEELRQTIKELLNGYLNKKREKDLLQYSLIFKILSILCNDFLVHNKDEKFLDKSNKYEDRIIEINNYIKDNFNKSINLTDLAEQLYLSSTYLSKFFKKYLGMNFIEYTNKIRVHYAIDDLLYSDKSMLEIALDNGFSSSTVFNKAFKKIYGVSPSAYRKKIKENAINNNEKDKLLRDEIVGKYFNNNEDKKENNKEQVCKYIKVDSNNKYFINNHWSKMINIGKASELLKSDIQEHILILKNKLKFKYIRFWSVFDDDMYIDINNDSENYNFDLVDRVLDFLLNNNIKPFIEFANKGKRIHKNIDNELIVNSKKKSFSSLDKWGNILERFIIHAINRYGKEEVETWYCEIMNIEEMSGISDYCNRREYIEVFEIAYKTLKKHIPSLKIGGAGFNINYNKKNFENILKKWSKALIKPDFLTVYFYPYINDSKSVKRSTDKNFVINKINEIKKSIKETLVIDEIIISEWNLTISNRNFINDSCYKGAYIVKNLIDSVNEVNMLGYWIASDLFSELYDTTSILSGGTGLLTRDGIRKPAFYGINFMNHLGNNLIEKGENYIITSNNEGYIIVCHNYKHPNYYYYLKDEDSISPSELDKIFDDNNNLKLNFEINNSKNGEYLINKYSLNSNNGSILDEWSKLEYKRILNQNEIEYLNDVSKPKLTSEKYLLNDSVINIEVSLLPHEINCIEIKYKY